MKASQILLAAIGATLLSPIYPVLADVAMPPPVFEPSYNSPVAPTPVAATPAPAPTPQAQLATTAAALDRAVTALDSIPASATATFGDRLSATAASLKTAAAEVAAAEAYLGTRRTAAAAPVPAGIVVPRLPQVAPTALRTPLVEAVDAMNEALAALVGDTAAGEKAPALDLPAERFAKIVGAIGQAGIELSAGVEQHNATPSEPPEPETSIVPSVIAGFALTIACSLAGLHFAWKARSRPMHQT